MAEMKSESTAEGPYLLGMDIGTGGVRVGIFDRKGTPVVFEGVEFETHHPRPGRAEQDPETWWSCLVTATRRALEEGGVSPREILGIGVDATASTLLAVDEQGGPLLPAIMWMDVRASEEAARVEETGDRALKYSGYGAVSAEWGLPKVLWLKEKEREVYDGAGLVCDCLDWINHRLTGEWASSINVVSTKYFYDRDEGGWPESLYGTVGTDDALEKFPPAVLDLGSVVGGLRREAAEELGLTTGTPVAQGALDAYSGALGLGVVEPGKLALITGSSHVMIGQSADPVHGQGLWGAYTDAMIPGQYTVEAGQVSTGSVVAWFKNRYAGEAVTAEAQKRGVDADARRRLEPPALLYAGQGELGAGIGDAGRGWSRDLPAHTGGLGQHGPHRKDHTSKPRGPRSIQLLRGSLYRDVSADARANARDDATRGKEQQGPSGRLSLAAGSRQFIST